MAKYLGERKKRLCGLCGETHPPHMPDNQTFVPCCAECWSTISPDVRLQVLVAARQNETWESLVQIVNGWLEEKVSEIVREKMSDRLYEDN